MATHACLGLTCVQARARLAAFAGRACVTDLTDLPSPVFVIPSPDFRPLSL